jgi:hypothetical protein
MLTLVAAINKTTSAWAVGSGNGALDTGAIAASTWYHAFVIKNAVAQVVDILISLSLTAPALPSGYTTFRRIGSMKTNASSQWMQFVQVGDEFLWTTTAIDVSNAAPATANRTLYTLSVPTGVQVAALMRVSYNSATLQANIVVTSPDESDQAPGSGSAGFELILTVAGQWTAAPMQKRTNTSAQIGVRANVTIALYISTYGWIDRRGRDA